MEAAKGKPAGITRRAKKSNPLRGAVLADEPCKGNHTKGDALCVSDSTTRPPEKKG